MAEAQPQRFEGATPTWHDRLCDLPPPALFGLGAGVTATLVAGFFVLEALHGHVPRLPDGSAIWAGEAFWHTLVFALIIGYLPVSYGIGSRGGRQDMIDIRPLLRCSDAGFAQLLSLDPARYARRRSLAGLLGILGGALVAVLAADDPLSIDGHGVWLVALTILLFWGLGQIVFVSVTSSLAMARIDRAPMQIDLLNLRPLAPYVRTGLRNALLWLVGVSLTSLLFLRGDGGGQTPVTGVIFLALIGIAILVFVLPARGVHRRIRAAKHAELERVAAAIHGDRAALADTGVARDSAELSLADLVAYKNLVESVREWPFGRTSVLRLALYFAIPLGSWVGGALVERMLGAVLD